MRRNKRLPRIDLLKSDRVPSLRSLGIGGESFTGFRSGGRFLHSHDIVEICYVREGFGWHMLEEREVPAVPGSLSVIHYGQSHAIIADGRGMDVTNIYLDLRRYRLPVLPESLAKVLARIIPLHPRLGHRQRAIVQIHFEEPHRIAALLDLLCDEIRNGAPGHREAIDHAMALLLACCCRQWILDETGPRRGAPSRRPQHASQRLEAVRRRLDEHFDEEHKLNDLARMAGLQRNYLCRLFKRHTGNTVCGYLLNRRLERALILLRQTDDKITAIAMRCGFGDTSVFNRMFKREIGVSPSEYRRQSGSAA